MRQPVSLNGRDCPVSLARPVTPCACYLLFALLVALLVACTHIVALQAAHNPTAFALVNMFPIFWPCIPHGTVRVGARKSGGGNYGRRAWFMRRRQCRRPCVRRRPLLRPCVHACRPCRPCRRPCQRRRRQRRRTCRPCQRRRPYE